MITLKEVLDKSIKFLSDKKILNSKREAEDLIAHVLSFKRIDLYTHFDKPLVDSELDRIRENLKKRASRIPLAYIEGSVEFYGCQIKVNEDVLIPRCETELLVDLIVKDLEKVELKGKILWDLCTGSGAIAIALKKRFPDLKVIASDLSIKALEVAQENADLNEVDIELHHGDLFQACDTQVNFLVSNPPYIPESEYQDLEVEVKNHEPKLSLVSGLTGLEIYERIANDITKILKSPAKAYFEIGYNQGSSVKKIFYSAGLLTSEIKKDYSQHDRFFLLELE